MFSESVVHGVGSEYGPGGIELSGREECWAFQCVITQDPGNPEDTWKAQKTLTLFCTGMWRGVI